MYHTEEFPGMWNDHGCKNVFFPICQYFPNGNPHDGQDWPTDGGCPKGWSQFAGNCYIIPIDGNSISDGLKYKEGYHLAKSPVSKFSVKLEQIFSVYSRESRV